MIAINQNALKAISLFMANNDTRWYLKGILVEANATETRLVATDGHALAMHRDQRNNAPNDCDSFAGIIPAEAVKAALKIKMPRNVEWLALKVDGTRGALEFCGTSVGFEFIDAKFPDYLRALPSTTTGEVAQYDPDLLVRFKRAGEALTGSKKGFIAVRSNGDAAALVDVVGCVDFAGIVMPWRVDKADIPVMPPAWASEPVGAAMPLQAAA